MPHGGLSWRVTPFCVRVSPGPSFRRQSPPSNPDFVPSPTFPPEAPSRQGALSWGHKGLLPEGDLGGPTSASTPMHP